MPSTAYARSSVDRNRPWWTARSARSAPPDASARGRTSAQRGIERKRATRGVFPTCATISRMAGRGVVDDGLRAYYEQRAAEYDDWWLGRGIFARRERPGWDAEVAAVLAAV